MKTKMCLNDLPASDEITMIAVDEIDTFQTLKEEMQYRNAMKKVAIYVRNNPALMRQLDAVEFECHGDVADIFADYCRVYGTAEDESQHPMHDDAANFFGR